MFGIVKFAAYVVGFGVGARLTTAALDAIDNMVDKLAEKARK